MVIALKFMARLTDWGSCIGKDVNLSTRKNQLNLLSLKQYLICILGIVRDNNLLKSFNKLTNNILLQIRRNSTIV